MKKDKKIKVRDVIAFLQGHLRYRIYYSKFASIIRPHIKEQIDTRILSMNRECFTKGQCYKCGCTTTQLQMANKPCDDSCYPRMLNKELWDLLKEGYLVLSGEYLWYLEDGKFKKLKGKHYDKKFRK